MKFVIEMLSAEGPHWYAGIIEKRKDDAILMGAKWSPYWEDAHRLSQDAAKFALTTICNNLTGAVILTEESASHADSRSFDRTDGTYLMRAKYMQKGMTVRVFGHPHEYKIYSMTKRRFTLSAIGTSNKIFIGRDCEAWIKVVPDETKK